MQRARMLLDKMFTKKLKRTKTDFDVYNVTDHATDFDLTAMDVIRWAPVWMTRAERLLLYTLTFTLRPQRYLEIGTFKGGSALVVCAAMDALESAGRMVCVDPEPKIAREHWEKLEHRTGLITGFSPDVLPEAAELVGGPFDFVLIDGDHTQKGVVRDANGVMPFVDDGAYILFHDSLNVEVASGIDEFVAQNADRIADFGTLTREVTSPVQTQSSLSRWGGLRVDQVRRNIVAG